MNRLVFSLMLSTSILSFSAIAGNGHPAEIDIPERGPAQAQKTTVRAVSYQLKDLFAKTTVGRIKKADLASFVEEKRKKIKECPSVQLLVDVIHATKSKRDMAGITAEAYDDFINACFEKDPFHLICLLGFSDIKELVSEPGMATLRAYRYDGNPKWVKKLKERSAEIKIPRPNIAEAYLEAVNRFLAQTGFSADVMALMDRERGCVTSQWLEHPGVSSLLQGHLRSLYAIDLARKMQGNHIVRIPKNNSDETTAIINHLDGVFASLSPQDAFYGEILSWRNTMCLYMVTHVNGQYCDDLIEKLEQEVLYTSLSNEKLAYATKELERRQEHKRALDLYKTDKQKKSKDHLLLLAKLERYEDIYQILTRIDDQVKFVDIMAEEKKVLLWEALWKTNRFDVLLKELRQRSRRPQWVPHDSMPLLKGMIEADIPENIKAVCCFIVLRRDESFCETVAGIPFNAPVDRLLALLGKDPNDSESEIEKQAWNVMVSHPGVAVQLIESVNEEDLRNVIKNRLKKLIEIFEPQAAEEQVALLQTVKAQLGLENPGKRKREEEGPQPREVKRLKPAFNGAGDPRRQWKYTAASIEEGTCNASEEQNKGYFSIYQFMKKVVNDHNLTTSQVRPFMNTLRGFYTLHRNNAIICRTIIESAQQTSTVTSGNVRVILHPEQSDLNLEMRANNFYNTLMAAFEFVKSQNDPDLDLEFVLNGLSEAPPCYEARAKYIDDWREGQVKKTVEYLAQDESVASKTADESITDLAQSLLKKAERGMKASQEGDRVMAEQKLLYSIMSESQQNKRILEGMNWVCTELKKRLDADLGAAHAAANTYATIAEDIKGKLVGKVAKDNQEIKAEDVERVLRDVLVWDI